MTTREALECIQIRTGIAFSMADLRRWIDPLRGYVSGDERILLRARKLPNGRWSIKKEWVDEFIREVVSC